MAKTHLTAISIIKQSGDRRGPGPWTVGFRPEGQMGYHLYKISDPVALAALDAIAGAIDFDNMPEADVLYYAHDSREHAEKMERVHGAEAKAAEARLEAAKLRNERALDADTAAWATRVAK